MKGILKKDPFLLGMSGKSTEYKTLIFALFAV